MQDFLAQNYGLELTLGRPNTSVMQPPALDRRPSASSLSLGYPSGNVMSGGTSPVTSHGVLASAQFGHGNMTFTNDRGVASSGSVGGGGGRGEVSFSAPAGLVGSLLGVGADAALRELEVSLLRCVLLQLLLTYMYLLCCVTE